MNISQALKDAEQWLEFPLLEEEMQQLKKEIEEKSPLLEEAFHTQIAFGTGGMRGVMGAGPNRINSITLGKATQALAELLKSSKETPSIAIAYDCRHRSPEFGQWCADILSANGCKVYLFQELRPTPMLSFAVRELSCDAGIVITASHNPPEYNGYKVYNSDGCQITSPLDEQLVESVKQVSHEKIKSKRNASLIEILDKSFDEKYFKHIDQQLYFPDIPKDIPIVFTGIHGTGAVVGKRALEFCGHSNVIEVEAQAVVDGDFPTVVSPNPEEPEALHAAIQLASYHEAALLMGTDPDSDRVGIGVRTKTGEYELLNGNQIGALLTHYIVSHCDLEGKEFIAKTIVTSDLLCQIATDYGIECVETLTGFKFIGDAIKQREGSKTYIVGGEESYGYLIGDGVRDKDAISACCFLAEMASLAHKRGRTLLDELDDIYLQHGVFQEDLISLKKPGLEGKRAIADLVNSMRTSPPSFLDGEPVVEVRDYLEGETTFTADGRTESLDFPPSNVVQLVTENGTKVTIRPSGTEPKVKLYFSVNQKAKKQSELGNIREALRQKIDRLKQEIAPV